MRRKDHRYFSIVENRRLGGGKTAQRTVLYLGAINDRQQAAWRNEAINQLAVFAPVWAAQKHLSAEAC